MGQATGYSKPYLWKLEAGNKEVKAWHIRAYDRALGGDAVQRRALMIMGGSVVPAMLWSELELPIERPKRVESEDVAALADTADHLTGLGLRHGGRAAAAATRGQLRYAASLLDLRMPEQVRLGLLLTVARLADRSAWAMADIGQLGQAGKVYDFALGITPDTTQRWLTLVNLADLRLKQHDPKNALQLLDQPSPCLPVLRFLEHSTRAYAHALLGQLSVTLRHVDRADDAHSQVDPSELPDPVRPYASGHGGHAHAAAGKALHVLAVAGSREAKRLGVERLEAAINAFGAERAHAVAGCETRLKSLSG